eukprot:m.292176 g.292176  ORF g.292176 m.292176 type:complete len:383 (+) comp19483_c0_seq3:1492-2640(+)
MTECFRACWIVCLDESMAVWTSEYTAPGFMVVKRKPHPFGNEYHTVACGKTAVITAIELVEGKDRPSSGPHATPEFVDKGKTVGLLLRMTKALWGSSRVVILDSGFCVLDGIIELAKRGLFSTAQIKKKGHWPKGIQGNSIIAHMQNKPVGTIAVVQDVKDEVPYWISAFVDSKVTSLMMHTWGSTAPEGKPRKRRVAGDLVDVQLFKNQWWYYYGRHAVDDNNNVRQGSLGIEEAWAPRNWQTRQLAFVISVCEANAFSAYNYFECEMKQKDRISLRDFRRLAVQGLIEYADSLSNTPDTQDARKRRRVSRGVETHELITAPQYAGKWLGDAWKQVKTKYQQTKCRAPTCTARVRTHCKCDHSLFLCSTHFAAHVAELYEP